MKHDVRLAALIVNYNTGSFAESCVGSLLGEWQRAGRKREKLSIVLVDNASPDPQEAHLERLSRLGVEIIRSQENLGYARGMNLCYEHTRGAPGDVVAILNPDLHFLPGSIETLLDYVLDHPEVGAVDPAASVDPRGVLSLPRNLLPTPLEHLRVTLATLQPFFGRAYSRYRLKRSLPWWTSAQPLESDMLSGCCLFLRRAVVEELGRPMDPRYPLYFEDTDLFTTLRRRGYKLVHHTGARILHHWSRSAKVDGSSNHDPTLYYETSRGAYFEKFHGPLGRALFHATNALARRWPRQRVGRPIFPVQELGDLVAPVELTLPRPARYLIEMTVIPTFVICSGSFGNGDHFVCPPDAWEWFFPIDYFARAVDLDTGEGLGCWHFRKVREARVDALSPAEVEAYGEELLSAAPLR